MSKMRDERIALLDERAAALDVRIASLQRSQADAEKRGDVDREVAVTHRLAAALQKRADVTELRNDLDRETMVLFFEREEQETARRRAGEKPVEGRIDVPQEELPGELTSASATVDEIVQALRIKRNWSYQKVVDFLLAQGKTKKNGGTNWHTSDVYAIQKRLLRV